jgi:ribosomal protein S18 acetylase RimI-like enzyme
LPSSVDVENRINGDNGHPLPLKNKNQNLHNSRTTFHNIYTEVIYMTVTIRQGNLHDFKDITAHYGPGDSPWDPFGNEERLKRIPLEGLRIAETESNYAGFLYWFIGENPWFDRETKRYAYITELHVVEEYQNRGVGTSLLEYAVDELRTKPVTVFISTTEGNMIARTLYEKAGFRPFSQTIHYKLSRT